LVCRKAKKGVYARLAKHYLDIMSGQYQIPRGFLNGQFVSPECTKSGWWVKRGNEVHAGDLQDPLRMKSIHEAGHKFAHQAFARIAISVENNETLKDMERYVISELEPAINLQSGNAKGDYLIIESTEELGWVKRWKDARLRTSYRML
jgi:hypothetical protein